LGIVFGIKQNISSEFLQEIQNVGLTHVIAASGMNVTLVSGFIFYFLSLFFKRQLATFLSILGIVFYVALAGFEPSIIRAAIMGIIVFSSQILGRGQYTFLTLLLTGFIMLFISPEYLLSISFQLSYTATLGILYLPKLFTRYVNLFTQDLITTLSAQIATLPILLLNFGSFSVVSILVNVLVLWTIPILMILGSLAAIFSPIFPIFSTVFLYLCLPFLIYFEKVVSLFSGLMPQVSVDSFPWQFAASYYCFFA
jgi:competence protein ComEC